MYSSKKHNIIYSCIHTLKYVLFSLIIILSPKAFPQEDNTSHQTKGSFYYIYGNKSNRDAFFPFYENVFRLYPEIKIHDLVLQNTLAKHSDKETYILTQKSLKHIKPLMSDITYTLPALFKQKKLLARQTADLLPNPHEINGYLEIGTTGRYYGMLNEIIPIKGNIIFLADTHPTYRLKDIVDRGQFNKIGESFLLENYQAKLSSKLGSNSIGLVTIYIGLHHCPIELRDQFLQELYNVMKPDAYLIIRDHNVTNEKMENIVSLAHDVFNMGTGETWETNEAEYRQYFTHESLKELLSRNGFKQIGPVVYQEGDPTLNGLMLFVKKS